MDWMQRQVAEFSRWIATWMLDDYVGCNNEAIICPGERAHEPQDLRLSSRASPSPFNTHQTSTRWTAGEQARELQRPILSTTASPCCMPQKIKNWIHEWVDPDSQYSKGLSSSCTVLALHACVYLHLIPKPCVTLVSHVLENCAEYSYKNHMGVYDILENPTFSFISNALRSLGEEIQRTTVDFSCLEMDVARARTYVGEPVSILIIKPPETIAIHVLATGELLVFDSHPRPHLGLTGAMILQFADWHSLVQHLELLWPYVEDCGEDLQSQLINSFSAHLFGCSYVHSVADAAQPSFLGESSAENQVEEVAMETEADASHILAMQQLPEDSVGVEPMARGQDAGHESAAPRMETEELNMDDGTQNSEMLAGRWSAEEVVATDFSGKSDAGGVVGAEGAQSSSSAFQVQIEEVNSDSATHMSENGAVHPLAKESGTTDGLDKSGSVFQDDGAGTIVGGEGAQSEAIAFRMRIQDANVASEARSSETSAAHLSTEERGSIHCVKSQEGNATASAIDKDAPFESLAFQMQMEEISDSEAFASEMLAMHLLEHEGHATDWVADGFGLVLQDDAAASSVDTSSEALAVKMQLQEITIHSEVEESEILATLLLQEESCHMASETPEDRAMSSQEGRTAAGSRTHEPFSTVQFSLKLEEVAEAESHATSTQAVEDASETLANRLQVQDMQQATWIDTLLDEQPFECAICMNVVSAEDVFLNDPCGHKNCRECIRRFVVEEMRQRRLPPQCPSCRAANPPRQTELLNPEDVLVEHERIEYLQQSYRLWLDSSPNARNCPTQDCTGVVWMDEESGRSHCPMCDVVVCTSCMAQHGADVTCEEHQTWAREQQDGTHQVREMVWRGNLKECPNCKNAIEKESGCNRMDCRCGCCFCYVCGEALPGEDPYSHFYPNNPKARCVLFNVPGEA